MKHKFILMAQKKYINDKKTYLLKYQPNENTIFILKNQTLFEPDFEFIYNLMQKSNSNGDLIEFEILDESSDLFDACKNDFLQTNTICIRFSNYKTHSGKYILYSNIT